MIIELHIFTNSTVHAPSTKHIENTYKSFMDTFKFKVKTTVWCDRNPNVEASEEYINSLKKIFPTVNDEVGGMSHGYHLAARNSNAEFLFMLEHDWDFLAKNINHTLPQIVDGMRKDNILHLRFNRKEEGNRDDVIGSRGMDLNVVEIKGKVFDFCMTDCVSNNPHIINRKRWLDEAARHTHYVRFGGAYGLEEFLTASPIRGAMYGPLGHPPTIYHTDGKHLTRQY
jgi:hypothetical protein